MWFSQALIYRCSLPEDISFNDALMEDYLKPCPPHARFIYGWLPMMDHNYVHEIANVSAFALGKEERILPRQVIQRMLVEQIQALEIQRGYPVKRAEKLQLAEELEFQLLPKSFCVQKKLFGFIDLTQQHLVISSASNTQSSQLIALLRKSIADIVIEPYFSNIELSATFTHWVLHPESLPNHFSLASNCILIDASDEKKRFHCKGFELPSSEVCQLIEQGLTLSEISLIWQDRIEFTLTHDFAFKKIRCLDYLVDEFHELRDLDSDRAQQDASLALLTGEWRSLLADLSKVLVPNNTSISEAVSIPA